MKNGYMEKDRAKRSFQTGFFLVFLCAVMISFARAETINTLSLNKSYSIEQLDQMLAPIALYPDALLAQMLVAATHPEEVRRAGKWLKANRGLDEDAVMEAAADFDWQASVKSLLPFPEVLGTMSSNMGWTVKLGSAFNTQREKVMERIQYLRRKARETGNLESDGHMRVAVTGNSIAIEPVSREVVYVPYYHPARVYGPWWWPGHAPYYWRPWQGHAYYPGHYTSGFTWGNGIFFSYTRFPGRMDWHRRHVHRTPPGHPVHARPNHARPRPERPWQVKPGERPGTGSHHPARPGSQPGASGLSHARPEGKPHLDRSVHAKPDQRPGSGTHHPVRPGDRDGNRPSRVALTRPASASASGERQRHETARAHPRPQQAMSRQAGPRSSGDGDRSFREGGRGERRGLH